MISSKRVVNHWNKGRYPVSGSSQSGGDFFCCFLFGLGSGFFNFVLLFEPFHTAGGIHNFLFSRHKRMAIGTNFNANIFFGGFCFNNIAANTRYCCFFIFRMNAFFHFFLLILLVVSSLLIKSAEFFSHFFNKSACLTI